MTTDSAAATTTSNVIVNSNNNIIELSENFYLNSNKKKNSVKIQVRLNAEGIYLRRETEQADHINEQLIRLDDIIGSRHGSRLKKRTRAGISACRRSDNCNDDDNDNSKDNAAACQKDTSVFLYIYAYIKQEKPLRRMRTVRILRFCSYVSYEENLKTAERWHHAILVNKGRITPTESGTLQQEQKKLLILLNPKSGSGKGRQLFHNQVAPVLKEAEMSFDLQITTHANFAFEFIRTRADLLQRYSGIVVASGDGLFYEVLNGLMERSDWRVISRMLPIGIIPCGSGNGLAKSIAHCYNEPYEPKPIMNATLTCVSGKRALMDIVRIELAAKEAVQKELYSFLSVGWGLIADIDIESERLRSIGAQRFTLWTIRRLINLRTYKGKLYYLPWQQQHVPSQGAQDIAVVPEVEQQIETTLKISTESAMFPMDNDQFYDLSEDHEFEDVISLDRTSFRPHSDSWHSATSRRTAYYSLGGQSTRSRRSIQSRILAANAELEKHPPASNIPPLNMPLSSELWVCEDGEYIMVHAAYTTHLAADVLFAPNSRLDDGIIYLVIIRAGVGRTHLLNFILGMSSGTHLPEEPNEFIQVVPVSAFRIEPTNGDGIITVDGERVDYGPIQGEIFPGMVSIMVPSGN